MSRKKKVSSPESQLADLRKDPEFQLFEDALKKIVHVPKKVVDDQLAAERHHKSKT